MKVWDAVLNVCLYWNVLFRIGKYENNGDYKLFKGFGEEKLQLIFNLAK